MFLGAWVNIRVFHSIPLSPLSVFTPIPSCSHRDTFTLMFIVTLLKIARKWSYNRRIDGKNVAHIHNGISAINKYEIFRKWVNLGNIMLSKVSQIQKDKSLMITFMFI